MGKLALTLRRKYDSLETAKLKAKLERAGQAPSERRKPMLTRPGGFKFFPSITEIHKVLFKIVAMDHGKYFDERNLNAKDLFNELKAFAKAQYELKLKA